MANEVKKRSLPGVWKIGVGLLAVIGILGLGFFLLSSRFVSANFIAEETEKNLNCRVQLGDVSWGFPGTLTLTDVRIAPRDKLVADGVKHDERPPLESEGQIEVGLGTVKVDAGGLVTGKLRLREILLEDVVVKSSIDEDGKFSLEDLFEETDGEGDADDGEGDESTGTDEEDDSKKVASDKSDSKEKSGEDDGTAVPPTLDLFRLKNGKFIAHAEETESIIELDGLNIEVRDFDIDPASLEEHRSANVHIDTAMKIFTEDRSFQWAEFNLETDGEVALLDETGEFNPDLDYTFVVKKGSRIADLPTLGKLGQAIGALKNVGIELKALGRKLEFDEDARMVMRLRDGDLSMLEPGVIHFSGHRLTLDSGSYVQTGNNNHRFEGELLLSDELSKDAIEESVDFFVDKVGVNEEIVRPLLMTTFKPALKEARLWLPFVSKEDLSRPKVDLKVKLKNPIEALEEDSGRTAIKLLEGLLRN
ncbi:MAG: hypothetical protein AAGA58_19995 [Verrucomicrobiota bacterium]